jgi:hypothetical protein
MSNRTPTTSVTYRQAFAIIATLTLVSAGLVWLFLALFTRAATTGDALYGVGSILALVLAFIPLYFLSEIVYAVIDHRTRRQ